MKKEQRYFYLLIMLLIIPILTWAFFVAKLHGVPANNKFAFYKFALVKTLHFEDWRLIAIYLLSFPIIFFVAKFAGLLDEPGFQGQKFKKFLRGTKIVTKNKLAEITKEKITFKDIKKIVKNIADKNKDLKNRKKKPLSLKQMTRIFKNKINLLKTQKSIQITIGGVPMPIKAETLHTLLNGSTGAGKSVTLREMVNCAIQRGDRLIVIDPDADMYSRFGKEEDIILNPYDERTEGWSIFNEIVTDFDRRNACGSIVPPAEDKASEEWNGYARVLLESVMKILSTDNKGEVPTMGDVRKLATIVEVKELKERLKNTDAASMFVQGADKALGSARFVLSSRLPIFNEMPEGDFSIRDYLANGKGNIYITWKEDQSTALKPLISAWIDIICTSVLSLEENPNRTMWLFLDELASMDKIRSLEDALTKGRRKGLRVVAGIQSISQLKNIYGKEGATTLMSCFRSLIVMGGSKTDAETTEEMSKALGEHEVIRDNKNKSSGGGKTSISTSEQVQRERVVMPAEIAALPELTGFISFAGDYPICRFKSEYVDFKKHYEPFVDRIPLSK